MNKPKPNLENIIDHLNFKLQNKDKQGDNEKTYDTFSDLKLFDRETSRELIMITRNYHFMKYGIAAVIDNHYLTNKILNDLKFDFFCPSNYLILYAKTWGLGLVSDNTDKIVFNGKLNLK